MTDTVSNELTNETTIKPNSQTNVPAKKFSNILKVKADPRDLPDDERKKSVKALAGAIAHGMRQFGEVHLRCFGDHAIAKAAKASAIASSYLAAHGYDLYTRQYYIKTEMDGEERTGLCFLCVSSQAGQTGQPPLTEKPVEKSTDRPAEQT
jgi:stage V sporulation protein SpoVS